MSAAKSEQISESELEERLGCRLPGSSPNGSARLAALMADTWSGRTATSLVSYRSEGRLAIIGAETSAREVAERMGESLACTLLIPRDSRDSDSTPSTGPEHTDDGRFRTIRAVLSGVEGYLGAFKVTGLVDGQPVDIAPSLLTAHQPFDMVLDLGKRPQLEIEVPPPGYYAPRDAEALERALEEIPGLVGEFEKPRYFAYNPDICAHGSSGLTGCTRCLEVCPTDAIRSIGERIEVSPYLCQGAGACAASCPTGAITYAFPTISDLLTSLRTVLAKYRETGGQRPQLLFHDGEQGRDWLARHAQSLPENVIPYELEEIGSLGMDAWLTLLAYGAAGIAILCLPGTAASAHRALDEQRAFAAAILQGMGFEAQPVHLLEAPDDSGLLEAIRSLPDAPAFDAAAFQAQDEKRTNIRLAVEHLYAQLEDPPATAPLPLGAPFGELEVDRDACTLCMACVSVCPAAALRDGGDEPKLIFIEWNCVQCGLCETACPEDAIGLRARFVYDPALRRESRLLNEDQPFYCIGCGKAFATTSVIERVRAKLAEHWMFQKPEAVRRLEMCEDCRVKDMFTDGGGLLDPHEDA